MQQNAQDIVLKPLKMQSTWRLMNCINRPLAAKPSRALFFIKLWAATLTMPEMEKACRKHKKKTCMENVAGKQGFALQQLFPYKSS